jgi:hypothetical protein
VGFLFKENLMKIEDLTQTIDLMIGSVCLILVVLLVVSQLL